MKYEKLLARLDESDQMDEDCDIEERLFGEAAAAIRELEQKLARLRIELSLERDASANLEAEVERLRGLLRECRHFVKALCDHDDATCGCYQHIVLRGIDAALGEGKA